RRRGGGAEIGDEVEEGGVRLMADRGHYWSGCACRGANKGLVGERQEILHRAAPAGDDDDVDVGIGVQRLQCANHLRYAVGPLHRYLADVEGDAGVTGACIDEYVVLGFSPRPADEPDLARKERQRALALGVEESFGREDAFELLDAREELADSHGADLTSVHAQAAAFRPEFR